VCVLLSINAKIWLRQCESQFYRVFAIAKAMLIYEKKCVLLVVLDW